jgi:anti-sigma regulatory factor (Ser/Thr protein kinase)
MTDVVTLQLPAQREFDGVAYLVLGGLAARLDLGYDVLDDVTTAVDELLRRADPTDDVTLEVEIDEAAIVATMGPFPERVADELSAPAEGLGLRRVLETVVDDVDVGERGGARWIEFRKWVGDGG